MDDSFWLHTSGQITQARNEVTEYDGLPWYRYVTEAVSGTRKP